jgi:DNA polymerase (family 10)
MTNKELAKIFNEIADFLAADKVEFKPFAYRKAARALEDLQEDVAAVYQRGGLKAVEDIPGIGESTGQKIEEYLKKGKIGYYEKLKRRLPVNWEEMTGVEGIGPKKAKFLYQNLGIKNLADLEAAARKHKIAGLPGFGEKSEANIIQGVEFRKRSSGRFLLGQILPPAQAAKTKLENIGVFEKVDIAGSLRRRKETIGDVDFLAITIPAAGEKDIERAMDFFTTLPGVEKVWSKGQTKSSVRMGDGFNMDIRILPRESYGAALQYFTGSKEHNIAVRRVAQEIGCKLSEYGLFRGDKMIAGSDEKGVYEKLGLQWMPPEMRENTGEVEVSARGQLPAVIGYDDLKGDLHCHSNWDGGDDSIARIAAAAQSMGYLYVGIADHTQFLKIENGLDEKKLSERNLEIDKLNNLLEEEGSGFRILKGCEANIMADGSIDIDDAALAQLDFAIAGVHSSFKMDTKQMTQRIIRAMENRHIDIISHPTGRLLQKRPEYQIDFEAICAAARRTGTILEINSSPDRLDLNDQHIRRAKDFGIKMVINTDSHNVSQLRFAEFGIAQARRGWAENEDIINASVVDELLGFMKK